MSKFSEWLRKQMAVSKTRQRHLAARIDVSATAVSKWRDGTNIPGSVSLVKLAEIFQVDPVWLMQLAGVPLPDKTRVPANSLFLSEFESLSEADKEEIRALVRFKAAKRVKRAKRAKNGKK